MRRLSSSEGLQCFTNVEEFGHETETQLTDDHASGGKAFNETLVLENPQRLTYGQA
mgnify:CR=1 FL=1